MYTINDILAHEAWEKVILGNTVREYAIAGAIFLMFLIGSRLFQYIIIRSLKRFTSKTATDIDDTFVQIIDSMRPPFYLFIAFYFSTRFLDLVQGVEQFLMAVLTVWIVYQVVIALQILIDHVVRKKLDAPHADKGVETAAHALGIFAKIALWAVGFVMALSNLGVDVTSLVAGLGIGGIAVALAAQNILGDLFSSFAIYFDRPFKVGDYIVTGTTSGTVKKVGIKTTRIKALQGEEIVVANKVLTDATIQNFKKLKERRVTFTFGVIYETDDKILREIPDMMKTIIEGVERARFKRAHFKQFDNSALTFEVVYFVESNGITVYMDVQQEINFAIREEFKKKKIAMAYPTQTVYMHAGK